MSSVDKSKLPYTLLLDPLTDRAAAYTQNHRLITETASAKLVAFAKLHYTQQAAWKEALHEPTSVWRPLPDWATLEVRKRCVLLWVRKGGSTDEFLASIPKR